MSQILIVEDEPIIRTELGRLLTRAGHAVAETGSVAEAGRLQPLDAFDLVIADLRLPGEAGTDLIARGNGTPVLIMTSYATVRAAVEALHNGALHLIPTPFHHQHTLSV